MPEDKSNRGSAIRRAIDIGTSDLTATVNSLIERETVTAGAVGADGNSTGSTDDGDDVEVIDPYGFAGVPPGAATTIVLAPGADTSNRVALALVSTAGRPATDAGDTAVWTSAGHSILLDDDGGIIVTSKDGAVIELDDAGAVAVTAGGTGSITITAGTGANVTINVDGGASVNIGDGAAVALAKILDLLTVLQTASAQAIAAAPIAPIIDNGVAAFTAFVLELTNSLVSTAGTTKAKGT